MNKSVNNPSISAREISEKEYPVLGGSGESLINEISSEVIDYAHSRGNSLLKSVLGIVYFAALVYFTLMLITG